MGHIYMIFFIAFIGFLIGMFTTALVMQSKGLLKPDTLDEVLIILGEVYDNSMMPPDAYYEARERIIALKESGHIKTMDLLQEMSIKRGRREALEEVLGLITDTFEFMAFRNGATWNYQDVAECEIELKDAVKKLMEVES